MRIVSRLVVIVVVLAVSVTVALPVSAASRNASILQQQPPPPCPTAVAGTHCVQQGEWLYCIGRAYQVTPWSIAQASGIPGPYAPYNPYPYYGNPYYGNYGPYNPYPYYYSYYAPWNYVYPGQRLTIPFNASSAWYNIPAGPTCTKQASVTPPSPWPPPQPTPMPYPVYPQY
jgi:hypothetical protein